MPDIIAEARALAHGVGVYEREDLVLYRLQGDDQRSWLNGQLTCDVRGLTAGDSVYGLAVNVRGRIMADLWVLDGGGQLCVLLPRVAEAAVTASFESQIIMEDVEFARDDDTRILSLQGPQAQATVRALARPDLPCFPADELGHGGALLLLPTRECGAVTAAVLAAVAPLSGMAITAAGYELARLRQRRPRFPDDFGPSAYPQEAGLKARAVSFNKGCYLGQEVVCTLENRGKVARALYAITSEGALRAGAAVSGSEGRAAGQVTSAVHDEEAGAYIGLAYLKRAQVEADVRLSSDGHVLAVTEAVA